MQRVVSSGSKLLRKSSSSDNGGYASPQPRQLTKSPPPSPARDAKRTPEPYPIPSNNPASQYTLLEKLGTGSFGTVYKAMHNDTKQIVAIKQIGEYTLPVLLTARTALTPLCQTWRTLTTISLRSNKRLQVSHNSTQST